MFWHASVCPHLGGGVPQPGSAGGGVPQPVPGGGYPSQDQAGVPQPGPGRGSTPARSRWGGGTPARSRQGGVPQPGPGGGYPSQVQVGYPCQVQAGVTLPQVPPSDLARGVPHLGYPHQSWLGVPQQGGTLPRVTPIRPGWGYPDRGVPTLGTPHQTWGYPNQGVPHLRYPPSDLARGVPRQGGGTPPSSTWYAAVGMPLAFTQEDFLVYLELSKFMK